MLFLSLILFADANFKQNVYTDKIHLIKIIFVYHKYPLSNKANSKYHTKRLNNLLIVYIVTITHNH